MRIKRLHIENFKSFKNLEFTPSDLTVILGPNGSGKSNFAMALDFLADTYDSGIEYSIAKKGGYENIAHRKIRRTKSPLIFHVEAELDEDETTRLLRTFALRSIKPSPHSRVTLVHTFAISAATEAIRTDFKVALETIKVSLDKHSIGGGVVLFELNQADGVAKVVHAFNDAIKNELKDFTKYFQRRYEIDEFRSGNLVIRDLLPIAARYLARMTVYQFSPQTCRYPGAPSPEPRLSAYGQNLPSLVDWLNRRYPKKWKEVMHAMREIVPAIEEISTEYLHTKTLGLFFQEEGIGRKWTAEDVSDGTIQSLAILSALADPRNSLMLIEELENSVHPWIVKVILNRVRKLSETKPVILTTHSPILINLVKPQEVWICHKEDNESHLSSLSELYPELVSDWAAGKGRLFDYLDMGLAPHAMPETSL